VTLQIMLFIYSSYFALSFSVDNTRAWTVAYSVGSAPSAPRSGSAAAGRRTRVGIADPPEDWPAASPCDAAA